VQLGTVQCPTHEHSVASDAVQQDQHLAQCLWCGVTKAFLLTLILAFAVLGQRVEAKKTQQGGRQTCDQEGHQVQWKQKLDTVTSIHPCVRDGSGDNVEQLSEDSLVVIATVEPSQIADVVGRLDNSLFVKQLDTYL
jgi:hypothetical protein